MKRNVLTASAVVLLLCAAGSARADAPDGLTAEALFAEGRRLMTAGKLEEACPKFAESQRLDPAPGTVLNLAACYEKAGKTASAWYAYRETEATAARAGQKDRVAFAKKQSARLEATLSRVTIALAQDAWIDGLEIRRDGSVLGRGALDTPLPVDPGTALIEAAAPGRRAWSSRVAVPPGPAKVVVTVPLLEHEVSPRAIAPAPPIAKEGLLVAPESSAPIPAEPDRRRGQAPRVVGVALGAAGLVAIGVGAYFGLKASATYDRAKSACGGGTVCPDESGLRLRDDAGTEATASTLAFVGGAALAAGGALLFLTAAKSGSASRVGLAVSPRASGLSFSLQGSLP